MRVFIDTGAFIALTDADDENHKAAKAFYKGATEKGARFITTNFVICETINYLRARVSHNVAVVFRENLKKSGLVDIVTIISPMEDTAFSIFKLYSDKDFSFTDCTSFAVMKSLRITSAFAFDRHFEQMEGIKKVP